MNQNESLTDLRRTIPAGKTPDGLVHRVYKKGKVFFSGCGLAIPQGDLLLLLQHPEDITCPACRDDKAEAWRGMLRLFKEKAHEQIHKELLELGIDSDQVGVFIQCDCGYKTKLFEEMLQHLVDAHGYPKSIFDIWNETIKENRMKWES